GARRPPARARPAPAGACRQPRRLDDLLRELAALQRDRGELASTRVCAEPPLMSPLVDLRSTYLYADGPDLVRVEAASLWRRLIDGTPTSPEAERVAHGAGWLVGVFVYEASWPSWEMHPEADEVVHVSSRDIELVLDEEGGERRVRGAAGATIVVPRGACHRATVHAPGAAVHVTFGKGT